MKSILLCLSIIVSSFTWAADTRIKLTGSVSGELFDLLKIEPYWIMPTKVSKADPGGKFDCVLTLPSHYQCVFWANKYGIGPREMTIYDQLAQNIYELLDIPVVLKKSPRDPKITWLEKSEGNIRCSEQAGKFACLFFL